MRNLSLLLLTAIVSVWVAPHAAAGAPACDANLTDADDIEAAIVAASDNDVICLAPGTYTPTGTINITRPVTLAGAQYGVDPRTFDPIFSSRSPGNVATESIIAGGTIDGLIEIEANDVVLDGLQITDGDVDVIFSNDPYSGTIIRNNIINGANTDEAIQLRDSTNPLIEYNRIFDVAEDGINVCCGSSGMTIQFNELDNIGSINAAIYLYGNTSDFGALVRGNVLTNVTSNDGIKIGQKDGPDASDTGGTVAHNKISTTAEDGISVYTSNNIVQGNDITGSGTSNGAIYVTFATDSNNLNNNRVLANSGNGVKVGAAELYPTNTLVNNNCIAGNSPMGVEYTPEPDVGSDLNAQSNWWGAADGPGPVGPGSGDGVVANVDFTNFLTDASCFLVDTDGDRVFDNLDNCPTVWNERQEDANSGTPEGDACEISTMTVTKVWTGGTLAGNQVSATLDCGAAGSETQTTSGLTYEFEIPEAATSCDVYEAVPIGYTPTYVGQGDGGTCTNVDVSSSGEYTCEITNTVNTATIRVNKQYTDGAGASVTVTMNCTSGTITTQNPQTLLADGFVSFNVQEFNQVIDQSGQSTTCTITESDVPPNYYQVSAEGCAQVVTHQGIQDLCVFVNAPTRTTFEVNKVFSDGAQTPVHVTLDCDHALIPDQDKIIHPDDDPWEVKWIRTEFDSGDMNCTLYETPLPGYTAYYWTEQANDGLIAEGQHFPLPQNGVPGTEGCRYENVVGGERFQCKIFNELQDVEVEVVKKWFDEHPEFNNSFYARIKWECENARYVKYDEGNDVYWHYGSADPDGTLYYSNDGYDVANEQEQTFWVYPNWDVSEGNQTICEAYERIKDSSVASDDSDCASIALYPGISTANNDGDGFVGATCTIVNTRIYEGIPTLSQYGLALMALLMLGVGLVGFRRFV